MLRSERVGGFTFDIGGSHVIFSRNEATLKEMLSMLGSNLAAHQRKAFVRLQQTLVPYPLESGLWALPPEDRADALVGFLEAMLSRDPAWEPRTLEEWVRGCFGDWIAEKYLVPYNEKVWKRPLSQISADWVRIPGRLPVPDWRSVVKAAAGVPVIGYAEQSTFFYPLQGGVQALFDSVMERVKERGATIVRGEHVSHLRKLGNRWVINGRYRARMVVSTIPLPEVVSAVEGAPKEVEEAARRLDYNRVVVVGIALKRTAPDHHWVYVPDRDVIFHRYAWVSNYSPYNAPKGHSALIAEVTLPPRASVELSEVGDQTVASLEKLGVIREEEVMFVRTWFHEYGYPVYTLDHAKWRGLILEWLESQGIVSVGRWGRWHYWNMDKVFENVRQLIPPPGKPFDNVNMMA